MEAFVEDAFANLEFGEAISPQAEVVAEPPPAALPEHDAVDTEAEANAPRPSPPKPAGELWELASRRGMMLPSMFRSWVAVENALRDAARLNGAEEAIRLTHQQHIEFLLAQGKIRPTTVELVNRAAEALSERNTASFEERALYFQATSSIVAAIKADSTPDDPPTTQPPH